MTARRRLRFTFALCVCAALVQVGLARLIAAGAHFGLGGIVASLVAGGMALALVFTALYDGRAASRRR